MFFHIYKSFKSAKKLRECPVQLLAYLLLYLNLKLSSAKLSHLTGFWYNNVCLGAEGMWGWASYTVFLNCRIYHF